jgi:hypothetical protein
VSDHTPAPATIASVLAASVGLVWLAGASWPLAWGSAPALGLAIVVAIAVARRTGAAPLGGWPAAFAPRRPEVRVAIVVGTGFVAAVFGAAGLVALGQVLFAFPAAILPTLVAIAALAFGSQLSSWLRLAIAPALVGLALVGARCESEGVDARGGAYSGPILGIHPFQSTAVIVDGFGPFDLPINDFVEPAGGRGYDPVAYGEAIELALHRIAEVHFAHGPLRAHQAFADATVEPLSTSPVRERLDRDVPASIADVPAPRIVVRSGTTGPRSRVEFVCPGQRDDPRPPRPDTVTSRSCPTKYAPEASAGLGLTGRWPGYAEWRGNERLGLVRALGGSRPLDEASRSDRERERWGIGAIATLLVAVAVAWPSRRRGALDLGPATMLVLPLGVLVVLVAVTQGRPGAFAAFERAASWRSFTAEAGAAAATWIGVAAIAALWWPGRPRRADDRSWPWLAALLLAAFVASDLQGARWLSPAALGGEAPFADAVALLADRVAAALGLVADVGAALPSDATPWLKSEQVDAIAATCIAAALVAACFALVGAVARVGDALPQRPRALSPWLALAAAGFAVALAVSRKTDGGLALIPAATGVAIALGSTLRRIAARGAWPRDHVSLASNAVHWSWCAAGALATAPFFAVVGRDPVLWLYAGIATGALALQLAVVRRDPAVRPASAPRPDAPRAGSQSGPQPPAPA